MIIQQILLHAFNIIILLIMLAIPVVIIYFIYRLIKSLMKYNHDLKQGKCDGNREDENRRVF